jgi:hypothetical protein
MANETDGRGPSVHVPARRSCLVHCDPGAGGRPGTRGSHRAVTGGGVADVPNACASLYPLTAIVRFHTWPSTSGLLPASRGQRAATSLPPPGPVARAHGGSGGHDDRATAVPTGRQSASGRFGVLPRHLAAAAGPAHLDPPVHRPVPPFGVRMCHPRWDVGQRGAHARQRPLRRRGRQRFLHHSRGWPLLSHRGERPSHLPAGANLRTRASGTTRSPTAELPLDVAGNHLPAAAACTTVDDA